MLYVTSDHCLFQILWTKWNECLTEAQLALVTLEVLIQGVPQGRILLQRVPQGFPQGCILLQGVPQGSILATWSLKETFLPGRR